MKCPRDNDTQTALPKCAGAVLQTLKFIWFLTSVAMWNWTSYIVYGIILYKK